MSASPSVLDTVLQSIFTTLTDTREEHLSKDFVLSWQLDGIIIYKLDWATQLTHQRDSLRLGDLN